MSELRIIASRFSNVCPLCAERWKRGAPIAPFGDRGEYAGRWGHPACVAADGMGLPSTEAARDRIAAIRADLAAKEQS